MSAITLTVNEQQHSIDVEPETPLLWVLRDTIGLRGTKYGCSHGLCGVCTVHINSESAHSYLAPAETLKGKKITTIKFVADHGNHALLETWLAEKIGCRRPGQTIASADSIAGMTVEDISETVSMNLSGLRSSPDSPGIL
jgi:isoquinoline 1-oxidoreductase subunit alpha